MNRFNFWQIVERPTLSSGHTLSLTEAALRFRLLLQPDARHADDHLFRNPHGLRRLDAA